MICPHCHYARQPHDDQSELASLICPNCRMPYAKNKTSPEALAKMRAELAGKAQQKRVQKPRPAATAAEEAFKRETCAKLWKLAQGAALVVFVGYLIMNAAENDAPGNSADTNQELQALFMCQQAITRLARDPENAEVPYVPNVGGKDEYYFAWGRNTKMARMRNGLGLDVAASASCIVNKASQQIVGLTLDGETII